MALVIGNTNYKVGKLSNPKNDARDLSKALESVGFKVTTKYDLTKFQMESEVDKVTENLKKGDAVFIFFAGHGLEIKNTNYLVPIGAKISREFHIKQRCVDADYILSAMEDSGASLRVMVLDACRSNPIRKTTRNLGKGLAPVEAPDGTIIVYSTAPGETAKDGRGNNSPFAKHLIKTLGSHPPQGLEINNMFMTVARAVKKETGQRAYVNNDASMDQFFIKPVIPPKKPVGSKLLRPLKSYYDVDIATVTKHAEYGFAEAQAQLGYMYSKGIQVKQDQAAAVRWAQRAVNGGSPRAMNNLGLYYDKGLGLEKNLSTAIKYYRMSAANGYPLAKYNIGVLYRDGWGVKRNGELAMEWFIEAALAPPSTPNEKTAKLAERNIGIMYREGTAGIKKDYAKATYWLRKAANRGYAAAQVSMGYMYDNGLGVKKDYKEAFRWYEKAANQKDASGYLNLGRMYQFARGVKKNEKKAFLLYTLAAEKGDDSGQWRLGQMYSNGYGVTENNEKAVFWYRKAAKQGHSAAQNRLGWHYWQGEGVKRNYKLALEWLRKSVAQGNKNAQCNLGVMYARGNGVTKSYKEANRLYRLAAEKGNVIAQWNLADNYERGNGLKKDLKKALYWYKKAAAQGDAPAKRKVRELEDKKLTRS